MEISNSVRPERRFLILYPLLRMFQGLNDGEVYAKMHCSLHLSKSLKYKKVLKIAFEVLPNFCQSRLDAKSSKCYIKFKQER